VRWYRDRATLRWIAARYLPWMLVLNLVWEAAHVRLYTLWQEAEAAYIAFSIVHCTLGDVLIGIAALVAALTLSRAASIAHWPWARIAAITSLAGVAYTIFSEWMNITLFRSWTYAEAMPTLEIAAFEIGLTPLAQWLVLPPLALYVARRRASKWKHPESA
jgi:hypothetical protein